MNKKAAIPIGIKIEAMLALMLAFALMVCLWAPVLAEQSAEAKDMRLEATEGTVTLKNSSGKSLSVREGMKLYSGYTLKTSAKSYAYVTLDSSKVVKLDANSEVEVRKDGSKLELLVNAGELFFNVTSPLADDETMNIRTSTMVTGIRGTSGYVSAGEDGVSSVSVLDGSVTAIVIGGTASAQVSAGTSGSVVGGVNAIVSDTLTESGIPGFVAVEIANDESLQQRIESDTGMDVSEIVSGADAKLASDEQQAAQGETGDGTGSVIPMPDNGGYIPTVPPLPSVVPTIVPTADPTTEPTEEPTEEPTTEPTTEPTEEPTPDPSPTESTSPGTISEDTQMTADEFNSFLSGGSTITIKQGMTLTISSDLTLNIADFMIDGGGTLATSDGATVTFARTAYIYGDITFDGSFVINSDVTLSINSGKSLTNNGTITNNGSIKGTVTNNGIINGNQPTT